MLDLVKSQRQAVENALENANNPLWIDSATVKDNQSSYDRFLSALSKYREVSREALAQELANQLAKRADEQNRREIAENLKRQAGVDLQEFLGGSERVQERLQQLTTANVALIKSIPTQYLDKVELAVTQAIVKGELSSELTKKIMEIGQSTESRAKLIARDQASKFNAALTQARHEDLGITHYRWSTSGDERVRESHIENDGKIFAYDDPPEETGHPGHDINCRCVAIPVLDKAEIEKAGQLAEKISDKPSIEEITNTEIIPVIDTRILKSAKFELNQIRRKFKHIEDFDLPSNKKNPKQYKLLQILIIHHLNSKFTQQFGTYRSLPNSKVFYNRETHIAVIFDKDGNFYTVFKPKNKRPDGKVTNQLQQFMKKGFLQ